MPDSSPARPWAEAPTELRRCATDDEAHAFARERTDRDRKREALGLHVVVLVDSQSTTVYARIADPSQVGHLSQRWLERRRRGTSPAGWSEQHHPRSEASVGPWKDTVAPLLDPQLIQIAKHAWSLLGEPPYVVEYEPFALPTLER